MVAVEMTVVLIADEDGDVVDLIAALPHLDMAVVEVVYDWKTTTMRRAMVLIDEVVAVMVVAVDCSTFSMVVVAEVQVHQRHVQNLHIYLFNKYNSIDHYHTIQTDDIE